MIDLFGNEPLMALSWKQPYAGLMLPPFNKIETRTWPTKYRGLVLICASQKAYGSDSVLNISGEEQMCRLINDISQEDYKKYMENQKVRDELRKVFVAGMKCQELHPDDGSYDNVNFDEAVANFNKEVTQTQEKEIETLRMQLAGCGVAAMSNTPESMEKNRIDKSSPYWCASYEDVCNAVEREMKYRDEVYKLKQQQSDKKVECQKDMTDKNPE